MATKGNPNIKNIGVRITKETARERQRASVKARLKNKRGRERLLAILEMPVKDERVREMMLEAGFADKDMTHETALDFRMIEKAEKRGDVFAYEAIQKKAGFMTEKHEVTGADGQPLIQPRDLTVAEAKELRKELEEKY